MTTDTDTVNSHTAQPTEASQGVRTPLIVIAAATVVTALATVALTIMLAITVLADTSPSVQGKSVSIPAASSDGAREVAGFVSAEFPEIDEFALSPAGGNSTNENSLIIIIPDALTDEGRELGDAVVKSLTDNLGDLNIAYILWNQHSYSTGGPNLMEDRGNAVSNHQTHINVTVHDKAA